VQCASQARNNSDGTVVGGFDVHHSSGHPFGALLNSYAIARVTLCASANAMPYAVIVLATHTNLVVHLCGRVPALGVLLADVGDGKTWVVLVPLSNQYSGAMLGEWE
jgi:hypothetical protein